MSGENREQRKPHGVRPSAELATRVRCVVDERGLVGASATLRLGKETLLRLIARRVVHEGTLSRVREALAVTP